MIIKVKAISCIGESIADNPDNGLNPYEEEKKKRLYTGMIQASRLGNSEHSASDKHRRVSRNIKIR